MPEQRSAQWYAGTDRNAYIHRAWMRRGLPAHAFDGRPHIAIANTASDLTPCNAHLNEVAETRQAGRLRGRRHPAEPAGGVAGRDAGAAHRDAVAQHGRDGDRGDAAGQPDRRRRPARRLRQDHPVAADGRGLGRPARRRRARAGRCSPARSAGRRWAAAPTCGGCSEEVRAGTLSEEAFLQSESSMIRSRGHCNTMGTASTMALRRRGARHDRSRRRRHPRPGQPPAGERPRHRPAGRRDGRRRTAGPATFLTRGSFLNAIVALAAIGGSTNAVVHLLAIAGRLGVDLTLDDFDRIGAGVPLLVDLQPAGPLPDGGLPPRRRAARRAARGAGPARPRRAHRHRASRWSTTSTTRRSGTPRSSGPAPSRCRRDAGIAVLRGNLAPDGAVIKPAAASAAPAAATAAGPSSSTASRTSTPASTTPTSTSTPTRCWCCAAAAPRATRACPRWPTCRCRPSCSSRASATWSAICDGRMSGTAYGTVVLHVAPEAAAGGPLGLVRDRRLDHPRRRGAGASTSTSRPRNSAARDPADGTSAGLRRPAPRLGAALRRPRPAGRHRRRPRLPRRLQRRPR